MDDREQLEAKVLELTAALEVFMEDTLAALEAIKGIQQAKDSEIEYLKRKIDTLEVGLMEARRLAMH